MDISSYNFIKFKDIKLAKLWIFIMIFIIISVILIFDSISYKEYYQNTGILIEKNILRIDLYNDDIDNILNNNNIILNNKNFAYKVIEILNTDSIYTKSILIKVNIDDNLNIKNNIFKIKILKSDKTILEYMYKKIGGI